MSGAVRYFKKCCLCENDSQLKDELNYLLGREKLNDFDAKLFEQAALCKCTFISKEKKFDDREDVQSYGLFTPLINIPISKRQSYPAWKVMLDFNSAWKRYKKRKIYMVSLEALPKFITDFETKSGKTFLNFISEFISGYYMGFDVVIMDPLKDFENKTKVKHRLHKSTGQKQYLAPDLNSKLVEYLPKDGSCLMALSWIDLYPTEDLNFELGESCFQKATGVFSFGRYRPKLFEEGNPPAELTAVTGQLMYQMIRVVSHELGHLFGLQHCVFFECAMNESTSMDQAMGQPLFLCPVCLRRVYKICGFSLLERYKSLLTFLKEFNDNFDVEKIRTEISWLEKCITRYFKI